MLGAQFRLNLPNPLGGLVHRNCSASSGCLQADGLLIKKLTKLMAQGFDSYTVFSTYLDDQGGNATAFEISTSIDNSEAVEG
jgi:hypothetical protein